jgi:hypothetical protein
MEELVSMLHEVFAVMVDGGGYSDKEKFEIELRAEKLLLKHGVSV